MSWKRVRDGCRQQSDCRIGTMAFKCIEDVRVGVSTVAGRWLLAAAAFAASLPLVPPLPDRSDPSQLGFVTFSVLRCRINTPTRAGRVWNVKWG
ncbi:unnamed protein product [Cylicostephanus goldi]|uniref:Uncharacterized protein n=1 Tax=Cylicostephanus goldi TaxID=71465 RepID=A0A3P7N4Q6_CYLGO|nr:unnamed protein product [Cylicostephanus goldi]